MIVYNFINYVYGEKSAEFKRKRKLADSVFDYAKKAKHEYHPVSDFAGFLMHVHLSNKLNEDYIIVAESRDVLPNIKEPYTFVSVDDYLKGATK